MITFDSFSVAASGQAKFTNTVSFHRGRPPPLVSFCGFCVPLPFKSVLYMAYQRVSKTMFCFCSWCMPHIAHFGGPFHLGSSLLLFSIEVLKCERFRKLKWSTEVIDASEISRTWALYNWSDLYKWTHCANISRATTWNFYPFLGHICKSPSFKFWKIFATTVVLSLYTRAHH